MDWLNYHHLYYFWMVAREGSIVRASEQLMLAQPTISAQIKSLETTLGEKLFEKSGRNLVLTASGKMVYSYAEEIFSLGRELRLALQGRARTRPLRLTIGVDNALPKLIVHRLLAYTQDHDPPLVVSCREANPDQLLVDLAVHKLDLVLSDNPADPRIKVHAKSLLLGECGTTIFSHPKHMAAAAADFPRSLSDAPWLLPTEGHPMRTAIDQFFENLGCPPHLVSEFDDSALMKTFGANGGGVFPGPQVIEAEICRQFGVEVVGRLDSVRNHYYAITLPRKFRHPAISAVCTAAREWLRGESAKEHPLESQES